MEMHVGKCSYPLKERTLQEEVLPAHRFQDMSATGSISPQPDLGIDVSAWIDRSPSGILPSRKVQCMLYHTHKVDLLARVPLRCFFSALYGPREALTSDGHTEPMGGNHAVPQPALLGIARIIYHSYP